MLRSLAGKILLLMASLLVVALLAEGLIRFVGLETASYHSISGFCEYDPDLGWNLAAGRRTVFRGRHFSALVEHNEQRLRDRVYALEPAAGRRRILVLGDSVAWCWGVEIDRCFTKVLERKLPETDVITMGVPGYSTAQELLLYERDGRRFNPDIVLVVFVGNDPVENMDARRRPRFRLEGDVLVLTNHPVPRRKAVHVEWLQEHSRLYAQANFGLQVGRELFRTARARRAEPKPAVPKPAAPPEKPVFVSPAPSEQPESQALTRALIERFHDSVAADGAELVVAATETPWTIKRVLASVAEQRGGLFVDLDGPLRKAAAAGVDVRLEGDPHYSWDGNRIIAETLLGALADSGSGP